MAGGTSDRVRRQVYRLFNFGAARTMSDAQLLDQCVTRRDEAAEVAFEEIQSRSSSATYRPFATAARFGSIRSTRGDSGRSHEWQTRHLASGIASR
jgi:hypothetical protein